MNCCRLILFAQLRADCRHLIPIRGNDTNTEIPFTLQVRKDFRLYYINLPLIQVPPGMITGCRTVHTENTGLIMILGHDYQFALIKLLITESYDFWMTTIMLPQ
ncbi:hypothetical protein SDC9_179487 [bioreactor metagenome]|uniref:Uncharacterized protein n=1 Tax=bioreactor metagenome TaxID=1076179 RepID=A0A645H120_9ZZZZ